MCKKVLIMLIAVLLVLSCACGKSPDAAKTSEPAASAAPSQAPTEPPVPDNSCAVTVFVPVRSDVAVMCGGKTYYPAGDSNCEYISVPAEKGSKIVLEALDGVLYTFRSWTADVTTSERTIELTASEGLYLTMNLDAHYGENIALGAHVTCAAVQAQGTTLMPDNLTDGSYSTEFYNDAEIHMEMDTVEQANMAVTIDLGEIHDISLVSLAPMRDFVTGETKKGFPSFVSIRVSTDGAAYSEVVALNSQKPAGGHLTHFAFTPTRARYVRVIMSAPSKVGLAEVEIR